jgi:DNA-binding CsgD family transcriptional regulator
MAWHQTEFELAIRRHEEALVLARELGDRAAEAFALNNIAVQITCLGQNDEARLRYEACVAIAREIDSVPMTILGLHNLAQIHRRQHDSVTALRIMEEVLALARDHGLSWPVPSILAGMGLTLTDLGEFPRALALLHECLTLAAAKGNLGSVIDGVECVARLAAVTGQPEQAVRLFGAGAALRDEIDVPFQPTESSYFAPVMTELRASLGEESFATAWAKGRRLSPDEALAEARAIRLETVAKGSATIGRHAPAHSLTQRELEVLRLLAAGHTNREIGELLYISPTTAARHVANIYNKLGVDSRAEVTAYAHKQGLI